MMYRIWKPFLGMMAVVMLVTASLSAATLKIGDDAPKWSGIVGIDGREHALADYQKAKLVVVAFITNHCPVAKAYQDRLIALQAKYGAQGVQVIAVNVNNLPVDKLDQMKARAAEKKYNFPYLYDPTQAIGRSYGATVTPHVFVLDQHRKLAYQGAIDDNMKAEKVTRHFLADAINALLGGKRPPRTETKAIGCAIRYEP